MQVDADGSTLTSHEAAPAKAAPAKAPQPSLDFLKGADRLLNNFPRLRASLFTAMCVMAQTRSSAFIESGSPKNEKEFQRVLKTLQGRFPGRLAYISRGDDEDGRGGSLWNPQQSEGAAALPEDPSWRTRRPASRPADDSGAADTLKAFEPPKTTTRQATPPALALLPRGELRQLARARGGHALTKRRRVAEAGLEAHCETSTRQPSRRGRQGGEAHYEHGDTRGQEARLERSSYQIHLSNSSLVAPRRMMMMMIIIIIIWISQGFHEGLGVKCQLDLCFFKILGLFPPFWLGPPHTGAHAG